MKICKECKVEKYKIDFYGSQGECKDCTKKRVKARADILSLNPDWIKKERQRGREKYRRLNYRERSKELNKNKFWKQSAIYKNLSRDFKTPKGFELHHWNYNKEFLKDVILLKTKEHRRAHTFLKLDNDLLIFKNEYGVLFDTREKHIAFLLGKGIKL